MFRKSIIAITLILFGTVTTMALYPSPAQAACASGKFLTFDPWYTGLLDEQCSIKSPEEAGGLGKFIWIIISNILDMIFQAIAYVAVGFIMYGGFMFMTSAGNPDQAAKGRKTLINAIVGLVIAVSAGIIVNLIMRTLKVI